MNHISGNIIDVFKADPNSVLVHQCNCRGVMGAGLAKQIRDEWPSHYADYREHITEVSEGCGKLLGSIFYTPVNRDLNLRNFQIISGLLCQLDYGGKNRHTNYAALSWSMLQVCDGVEQLWSADNLPTIYVPHGLGCGLGGGDWSVVHDILYDVERMYDLNITVVKWGG